MTSSGYGRLAWLAIVSILAGLIAAEAIVIASREPTSLGLDYRFFRDIGERWLADGSYYRPRQLSGPYDVALMTDVLYPPFALLLFVPLAVMPAILWWAVPVGTLAYVLWSYRPAPWAWVAMLLLLAWPRAIGAYVYGNMDIWAVAAIAAGLRWGWPAVFVAIKPTLAPFALVGVRRRSFWIAALALTAISIPMLPLWLDYVRVIRDLRIGADYSLGSVPLMLIPIVAWWSARRTSSLSQPAAATSEGRTTRAPSS